MNHRGQFSSEVSASSSPNSGANVLLPKWIDAKLDQSETPKNSAADSSADSPDKASDACSTQAIESQDSLLTDKVYLKLQTITQDFNDPYDPALCPNPIWAQLPMIRQLALEHDQTDKDKRSSLVQKRLDILQHCLLLQAYGDLMPNQTIQISENFLHINEAVSYSENDRVHLQLILYPQQIPICLIGIIKEINITSCLIEFNIVSNTDRAFISHHVEQLRSSQDQNLDEQSLESL